MILKFVFGKEIHVYDLKQNQSLEQVCLKIKQLFKKVPNQFILCYKNYHQNTIPINSNQQFVHLMSIIKGDTKIFKLYIHDLNQPLSKQSKSQQKIQTLNNQQFNQMTQIIQPSKQLDLLSDKFTNMTQLQEEIERFQQMQKNHENCKNQATHEFQKLEDKDYQKVQQKNEKRQESSDRQLKVALQQTSDPIQLKKSSKNEQQKQIFGGQAKQVKKQQKPQNQSKQINKNPLQLKPQIQQKLIDPKPLEQNKNRDPANIFGEIQDDFLSHDARCDICKSFPICGPRFKCVICDNYDLCSTCQAKFSHDHPLLKIYYSYQTPISVKVQIPQYKVENKKEEKVVYEKIKLHELNPQQRRQRVLSIASEMSQLLNEQLQFCINFVQANEEYTKQSMIQMFIDQKSNPQRAKIFSLQKKPNNTGFGIGNFFKQVKDFVFK